MGDKEAEANAVSVRTRGKGDQGSTPLEQFMAHAKTSVAEKSLVL
jgi:threonyl-tRNA synthetase